MTGTRRGLVGSAEFSSSAKQLEADVEKQSQLVANVQAALVACLTPTSLPERLAVEEKKLAQLQDQLRSATTARPKVLPMPSAIAAYLAELAQTLESDDPGAAGDVLRRALAPFQDDARRGHRVLDVRCPRHLSLL